MANMLLLQLRGLGALVIWYYNPFGRPLVSELPVLLGRFFDFVVSCNLWFWVLRVCKVKEELRNSIKEPSKNRQFSVGLVGLNFIYIYIIHILQNTVQLSFKIPIFNSLKIWKQLGWINIKWVKQVGIKSLN
jgi:tellurite resistance protein TehA-like permease